MAKVLLVDRIATEQECGNEVFEQIEGVYGCGSELMNSVPETLGVHGVTLDKAIEHLVPEMRRIVSVADKKLGGSITIERLGEINERVFTTLALNAAGAGLFIEDEDGIAEALEECGAKAPEGIYLKEAVLDDAVYLIEEALQKVLEASISD